MAVQSFVKGDDLKKLIEDKLINAQSVKYVLRQKGILPGKKEFFLYVLIRRFFLI